MKRRAFVLCSGIVFLAAGQLFSRADDETLAGFDKTEEAVFVLKNHGCYSKAMDSLSDSLLNLVRMMSTSTPEELSALSARGEIYLEILMDLSLSTARYSDLKKVLEKIPEQSPNLYALSLYIRMNLLIRLGELEKARALVNRLGIISPWLVIGPFENERGGGFDTVFGPEKEVDFNAEYQGKERLVAWRKNPAEGIFGQVDLDSLFNPCDQCLAYALTFITVDHDTDAALRLGSDEAVKVFLNGRQVLSVNARRLRHFDQDVVGIRLNAGKNVLMLKVCDRKGPWSFLARLTDPSGAPLKGARISSDSEGFSLSADTAPAPAPASETKVDTGAAGWFEKSSENGGDRADLYLGLLHFVREYKGEDSGIAAKHLDAFLSKNPGHSFALHLKALSESRRVDIAAEKDENRMRDALEKAIEADPNNVESRVRLGRYYLSTIEIPNKAYKHALAALKSNPRFLPATYLLEDIYRKKNMNALGSKAISNLSHDPENMTYPGLCIRLGNMAYNEQRTLDAIELWKTALASDFTAAEARNNLIKVALETGNTAYAKELLEQEVALDPYGTWALKQMAVMAMGDEDPSSAIGLLERALKINPEDDSALEELGNAYHLLEEEDKAHAAYKKALEINPKAKELGRYVEFLFEGERAFEDIFKKEAMTFIAAYPAGENPDNDSHEHILLHDVIKVNADGTSSRYHHNVVRVLNHEGANKFDYFSTFYTPGEQQCRIITARIIHPDGKIDEAKIDNRRRKSSPRFGGRAPSFADLPPIQNGDVVDIEYKIDDTKQSFFGDYFGHRHFFQPTDLKAVNESCFTLILPLEREFALNQRYIEMQPEVDTDKIPGFEVLTWTLTGISKIDRKRNMPGRVEFCPCVEASTYKSWDDLGGWWWNLIQQQCDINDEMKAKVSELTEGLDTEREKIRAVYNFVVSDIRYSDDWEFGVHGFKPYRATTIFSNRFGDCKDKSILMKSLLREAGIEANPVMIRLSLPRSKNDLTLPLVSHFNHAITYVPSVDGGEGIFLDGTAQHHTMEPLPDADRGATVFVVMGGPGKTMTTPQPPPESNGLNRVFAVEVRADGSAMIEFEEESVGTFQAMTRQRFLNPGKREIMIEKTFGSILGNASVEEVSFTDLENLNAPATYRTRIAADDFLMKSGDRFQLRSTFFPTGAGDLATDEERAFDLLLGPLYTVSSEIKYTLPEGFSVPEPPEDVSLDCGFASFSLSYESGDRGRITVRRVFSINKPRVESRSYDMFRVFCREAEQAEGKWIQVSKKR